MRSNETMETASMVMAVSPPEQSKKTITALTRDQDLDQSDTYEGMAKEKAWKNVTTEDLKAVMGVHLNAK
jgi:hypothetical protein